jgi:hypothetical protein
VEAAHTARREVRLDPVTTGTYRPRRPQDSFLYQLVQRHLETFLAIHREAWQDDDPIPAYVERAFRSFIECGIPAYGFAPRRTLRVLVPFA